MTDIDWSIFDQWSEDTITCQCGASFRSHGKMAGYGTGGPSLHSRKPCPACGATEGHRALRSDPQLMTISGSGR